MRRRIGMVGSCGYTEEESSFRCFTASESTSTCFSSSKTVITTSAVDSSSILLSTNTCFCSFTSIICLNSSVTTYSSSILLSILLSFPSTIIQSSILCCSSAILLVSCFLSSSSIPTVSSICSSISFTPVLLTTSSCLFLWRSCSFTYCHQTRCQYGPLLLLLRSSPRGPVWFLPVGRRFTVGSSSVEHPVSLWATSCATAGE